MKAADADCRSKEEGRGRVGVKETHRITDLGRSNASATQTMRGAGKSLKDEKGF